jgi:hypothetical protein
MNSVFGVLGEACRARDMNMAEPPMWHPTLRQSRMEGKMEIRRAVCKSSPTLKRWWMFELHIARLTLLVTLA